MRKWFSFGVAIVFICLSSCVSFSQEEIWEREFELEEGEREGLSAGIILYGPYMANMGLPTGNDKDYFDSGYGATYIVRMPIYEILLDFSYDANLEPALGFLMFQAENNRISHEKFYVTGTVSYTMGLLKRKKGEWYPYWGGGLGGTYCRMKSKSTVTGLEASDTEYLPVLLLKFGLETGKYFCVEFSYTYVFMDNSGQVLLGAGLYF